MSWSEPCDGVSRHASVRLNDPAGPSTLELFFSTTAGSAEVRLELSNRSGTPLCTGVTTRAALAELLNARDRQIAGDHGLALVFDTITGRIFLASDEFASASLLFLRRWELETTVAALCATTTIANSKEIPRFCRDCR